MLILLLYISYVYGTCIGSTEADCKSIFKGYCLWDNNSGSCRNQICYLIDDVSACNVGGVLYGLCNLVPYTPPQFVNSCQQVQLTGQRVYYYRFVSDLSFEEITSTSATLTSLQGMTPSVDNLSKLYSLDILSRDLTQLNQILNLYISYKNILIKKQSHPYFIERTIYEALQHTRDNFNQYDGDRVYTLIRVWQIVEILYKRLETFSDVHQTQYSFINFNHIHLKYLKLETDIATVTWDQYSNNGYLSMTVFYAEIFGLISPVSPVFVITTSDGQSLNYKLKWQLSTTLPIKLKQFDLITRFLSDSYVKETCSGGYCEANLKGAGCFVFTLDAYDNDCTVITVRDACYIALCKWDYTTNTCYQ